MTNAGFQLAAEALQPGIRVIAPWRDREFRASFPGRKEMIEYCQRQGIPVKATADRPYSSDENCLHISYEAGRLEDLSICGVDLVQFGMTVSPQEAPDQPEEVTIGFEQGLPVSVNGQKLDAYPLVRLLNEIGGRHGVGRIDMVENRFVGMKSRGVYEAPGMTLLYTGAPPLGTDYCRPRPDALAGPAGSGSCRDGLLRILVPPEDGCPFCLHSRSSEAGHWRGTASAIQREHYRGGPLESV